METIKYKKMDIDKIINVLISRGILAFPTDTVFGLGCIMNEKAIRKIYEVKGRSFDKPLPVMCSSLDMIENIAYVNDKAEKIIEAFVPGAITLIFKKKDNVEDYITQGKNTIGIRVPDDEFILDLIDRLNMPLMVTSANNSGEESLLKWKDVYKVMKGRIDAIVCEDATGDVSSTIVDVTGEDIKILREGPISLKEISEVLK